MIDTNTVEGALKEGVILHSRLLTHDDAAKLSHKMAHLSSTLIMLQRTIDSPDCSVYAKEISSVLDSAIEQVNECEIMATRLAGSKVPTSA